MARHLRANTETIVTIGPFVDKDDGLTPETGVTLSGADEAEIIKHGATAVTDISGATWAAITGCDGYYSLTITTALSDTEGQLVVVVQNDSVCLPVRNEFQVLSEAAYDSLYVAKDAGFMDVNIKTVGRADTQETEADNLEAACAAYSVTRGLTGTALPAAAADGAGGLIVSDAGGFDIDGLRASITGGAYALSTDANGRIRIVDGTGTGELDTSSGLIAGIAGTKNTLDDLNDITVANVWTTQLTESYAAQGAAPTAAQFLFAVHQDLQEFAISGTTRTVKKLDQSTTAFTGTLDDATNPTALTRAA